MNDLVETLLTRAEEHPLIAAEADAAITAILDGRSTAAEAETFLTVLHRRGETAAEIEGCARAMLRRAVRLPLTHARVADVGGTGGDGAGTFNISTTAALVVAAAGVPVVKHGNRAVTGSCGSLDMLRALGVPVPLDPNPCAVQAELARSGFAVAPTPVFHRFPAELSALRRRLGFRTVFNLAGPLAHPATRLAGQVVGVATAPLTEVLASVLRRLGRDRATVLHGHREFGTGLDEVSLSGPTKVTTLSEGTIITFHVTPEQFGLRRAGPHDLAADDTAASAEICRRVLTGGPGPSRDVILLTAGIALWTVRAVASVGDGVHHAAHVIDSGAAGSLLDRLTHRVTEAGGVR